MMAPKTWGRRGRRGFSLVEVAIALGVVAFCLVAIVGILVVGLKSVATATQERAALVLADAVLVDIRSTPAPKPKPRAAPPLDQRKSPRYQIPVPDAGDPPVTAYTLFLTDSGVTTANPAESQFRLTITLTPPPAASRSATHVHVRCTWPGSADPAFQSSAVETTTLLDRN